jgi:formylglycine-generating enzyme required for sulfatase activity
MLNKGKTKKPNELGLFDMSGGVLEITSSTFYDIDPYMIKAKSQIVHKEANPDFRIARGGYWNAPAEYCATNYVGNHNVEACGARLILKY